MTEENQNEKFDESSEQSQNVATEETNGNENEEVENVEEVEETEKTVEIPETELEQLKEKLNEEEEKYLRLYAEFENYKRRMKQEASVAKDYQAQRV